MPCTDLIQIVKMKTVGIFIFLSVNYYPNQQIFSSNIFPVFSCVSVKHHIYTHVKKYLPSIENESSCFIQTIIQACNCICLHWKRSIALWLVCNLSAFFPLFIVSLSFVHCNSKPGGVHHTWSSVGNTNLFFFCILSFECNGFHHEFVMSMSNDQVWKYFHSDKMFFKREISMCNEQGNEWPRYYDNW